MHFTKPRPSSPSTSTTNRQVDGVMIRSGLSVTAAPIEAPSMLAVRMIKKDSFSTGYILGSTDSMFSIKATDELLKKGCKDKVPRE